MKSIAIFGGSFNPPGIHHFKIVQEISLLFNEVIVLPCGLRQNKDSVNYVESKHRQIMCQLTFSDLLKVKLDFSDINKSFFTPTWNLQKRFEKSGNIFHVIGADLVKGGCQNKSEIQTSWYNGQQVWQELNFIVITRQGYNISLQDLPPQNQLLNLNILGSSSKVRDHLKLKQPITGLVSQKVEKYIYKNKLYLSERS